MNTIKIGPGLLWQVASDEEERTTLLSSDPGIKSSPLDVAIKYGWKVGKKDVRIIGHGKIPEPGQRKVVNKWLVMRASDYPRIVPQEAIDRAKIMLAEGVTIKGLLVADDLRHYQPTALQRARDKAINKVKGIDWKKPVSDAERSLKVAGTSIGSATVKSVKAVSSTINASVVAGGTKVRQKAEEVNWDEVKEVTGKGLKATAIAVAGVAAVAAVAAVALPLLAVAAVPAAVLTFDPLLLICDEELRWWVVAEWWD